MSDIKQSLSNVQYEDKWKENIFDEDQNRGHVRPFPSAASANRNEAPITKTHGVATGRQRRWVVVVGGGGWHCAFDGRDVEEKNIEKVAAERFTLICFLFDFCFGLCCCCCCCCCCLFLLCGCPRNRGTWKARRAPARGENLVVEDDDVVDVGNEPVSISF